MPSERAASTIFKVFGKTRLGIESTTSKSQKEHPTNRATVSFPLKELIHLKNDKVIYVNMILQCLSAY